VKGFAIAFASALLLGGCALQPAYKTPQVAVASTWQAPQPHDGRTTELVDWWQRFDDPAVAELIRIAEADSPSLAQAVASIDASRASLASSKASLWPDLTGSASLTREKQVVIQGINQAPSTQRSASLDASWEIDLFGKLRNNRESARAQLQASIDDWHDARISLAAEVADDYVQYRACRLLRKAYEQQAASQQQTARSTRAALNAGLRTDADVYLAEASAASASSTAVAQDVLCEELVKSLVELTGADEARLRRLIDAAEPALPEPQSFTVDSVPADLLRQRPDLASAERSLASAYAKVGAARADRLPSFSLSGSISTAASNLASPATSWSFGPSLSLPIFDGGAKKAAVDSALATYQKQLAVYRGDVRSAVKEVEQALVDLNGAARRSEDAARAAEQYRRYARAMEASWSAGFDSLLNLEEARRSAISAEVTLIELRRDRLRYWIQLYKALGGGWQAEQSLAQSRSATPQASEGSMP
jgi:NodT family efflux transporter outer membrane factor (OMF) lipoprotein